MKRKILILAISALAVLTLCGCSQQNKNMDQNTGMAAPNNATAQSTTNMGMASTNSLGTNSSSNAGQ